MTKSDMCSSCKWYVLGSHCKGRQCTGCEMEIPEGYQRTPYSEPFFCKCLTVSIDEECPYYEEASDGDKT